MFIDYSDYQEKLLDKGFINPVELMQERARRLDESRAMLDNADAKKAGLSATERDKFRRELEEVRTKLTPLIDQIEVHNELCRGEALAESRAIHGVASDGNSPRFRNIDTGEEIRAIKHGESFRSAIGDQRSDMSLGKLIFGAATGEWRGAEQEQRAYSAGSSVSGGYMLPTEMSAAIIDVAREKSVVSAAGALTIPMNTEEMTIARVDSDPTAYWVPENGTITESAGTFGLCRMLAKACCVYTVASLELIRNASNAQSVIENTIAAVLAQGLDKACLNGQGAASEPLGLLHSDQVDTYDVNGPISYNKLLLGCRKAWRNSVEPKSLICDANVRADVAMLKNGDGDYQVAPPELSRLGSYMTTTIGSTDSNYTAYLGDFSNCLIGIRNQIEIEVSGVADSVFRKKQVAIRGMLWADFAVCRKNDVVRLHGIQLAST